MPHIIIEYSDNLDRLLPVDDFVQAVHAAAVDDGIAPVDGIRTRAILHRHYQVADQDPANAFVAIIARLGPGRRDDEIQRFLNRLIDTSETAVAEFADQIAVAISAEIQFIDANVRINRNHVATRMAAKAASG